MFEDLFLRKKPIPEKLMAYGFSENLTYETPILNGDFRLRIQITPEGAVDTDLTEVETGEPYTLYKTSAAGSFVGEVRGAIETVLADVAERCWEPSVFRSPQIERLEAHAREAHGDRLEFLWPKFPDNAILRRQDTGKWYAVIMTVSGRKIGLDTDAVLEIVDLRMDPNRREELLSREHYYPGWHMNKKSWYTLVLDGRVPDKELFRRMAESYELAKA